MFTKADVQFRLSCGCKFLFDASRAVVIPLCTLSQCGRGDAFSSIFVLFLLGLVVSLFYFGGTPLAKEISVFKVFVLLCLYRTVFISRSHLLAQGLVLRALAYYIKNLYLICVGVERIYSIYSPSFCSLFNERVPTLACGSSPLCASHMFNIILKFERTLLLRVAFSVK